jgi:hypothetical protein
VWSPSDVVAVAEIVDGDGSDAILRAEPFEAIEVDLLDLWGETRSS